MFSEDNIIFGDIDCDIVSFFSNDIGFNGINLNNANLDDNNFDDCDPETINQVRLMACYNKCKQHQTYKKYRSGIIACITTSNRSLRLVYVAR